MKNLTRFLSLTLAVMAGFLLQSCDDNIENAKGMAEFSISLDEMGFTKAGDTSDSLNVAYHLLVSVKDRTGKEVLTDELIPVYIFGAGFVSEKIEIPAGEFILTKFMVMNASGSVVYASPLAGSPLAYLTNKPLPIPFVIKPEQTTRIVPEVIAVMNNTPDQFGYVNFGIQIIRPLTFYTYAIVDNPMVMAPLLMTQASLTVYDNHSWHYTFKLAAALNRITIRGGSDFYTLVVEKEGYMPVRIQIPASKLLATTVDNPLVLKIPYSGTPVYSMVLQPGPEEGKDAMISNLEPEKNFGAHPWFEATFLSEPVLTVMRSNRSLISFDINRVPKSATIRRVTLTLSFDKPLPWPGFVPVTASPGSELWYGAVLQQVTEPWEEYGVTWAKQPATVTTNQVFITPLITNTNMLTIDVTRLFLTNTDMANYGMLFKLYPAERFPGFRFASSDHPNAVLRPKLTVLYTLP